MYGTTYGGVFYAPLDAELLDDRGFAVSPVTIAEHPRDIALAKLNCGTGDSAFPAVAYGDGAVPVHSDRAAPLARWSILHSSGLINPSLYDTKRYELFDYEEGVSTLQVSQEHVLAFEHVGAAGELTLATGGLPLPAVLPASLLAMQELLAPGWTAESLLITDMDSGLLDLHLDTRLAFAEPALVAAALPFVQGSPLVGALGGDGPGIVEVAQVASTFHNSGDPSPRRLLAWLARHVECDILGRALLTDTTHVIPHIGFAEAHTEQEERSQIIYGFKHVYQMRDVAYMYWSRWNYSTSKGFAAQTGLLTGQLAVGAVAVVRDTDLMAPAIACRSRRDVADPRSTRWLAWADTASYGRNLYLDIMYRGVLERLANSPAPIAVDIRLAFFDQTTGFDFDALLVDGVLTARDPGHHILVPLPEPGLAACIPGLLPAAFDGLSQYDSHMASATGGVGHSTGETHLVVPAPAESLYELLYVHLAQTEERDPRDWIPTVVQDGLTAVGGMESPELTHAPHAVLELEAVQDATSGAVPRESAELGALFSRGVLVHERELGWWLAVPAEATFGDISLIGPTSLPAAVQDAPVVSVARPEGVATWPQLVFPEALTAAFSMAFGAAPQRAWEHKHVAINRPGWWSGPVVWPPYHTVDGLLFPLTDIEVPGMTLPAAELTSGQAGVGDDYATQAWRFNVPTATDEAVVTVAQLAGPAAPYAGSVWGGGIVDGVSATDAGSPLRVLTDEGHTVSALVATEAGYTDQPYTVLGHELVASGTHLSVTRVLPRAADGILRVEGVLTAPASPGTGDILSGALMNVLHTEIGNGTRFSLDDWARMPRSYMHAVECLHSRFVKCPTRDTGAYIWNLGPSVSPDESGLFYEPADLFYSVELHYDYQPDRESELAFVF